MLRDQSLENYFIIFLTNYFFKGLGNFWAQLTIYCEVCNFVFYSSSVSSDSSILSFLLDGLIGTKIIVI